MTNLNPPPYGEPGQHGQPDQPGQPAHYGHPAPPVHGQQPGPPYAPAHSTGGEPENPGKTLGVAGLVLSLVGLVGAILFPIAGIIVSAMGRSRSKKAGFANGPAKAGLIVGIILLVLQIIAGIIIGILLVTVFSHVFEVCDTLGPGTHVVDGITYNCG